MAGVTKKMELMCIEGEKQIGQSSLIGYENRQILLSNKT